MSIALVAAAPARADDAAPLYDPGTVTVVDLGLTEAAKQALRDDPRTYTDATLTLTVGDQQIGPYAIGAKLKGMGTFQSIDGKAAFKLKFAHSVPKQKILGLKGLTLNNLTMDYSMVRETISYGIFRAAGVPAPRTGYAYVRVNDEPFGFYLNLEQYDSVSLDRLFPQGTQHLYEGNTSADVDVFAREWYEVDEGDEDDQADLDALIAATDADGDFSDNVGGVADLAEMTKMWATESFVGHWDGYSVWNYDYLPNNYFLHSDPSGVFRMLPWGTDQTLQTSDAYIGEGISRLFTKCKDDTSCWNQWKTALRRTSAAFAAMAPGDALRTAMGTVAAWRACPARDAPSAAAYQAATEDVRTFLAGRRKDVADYLGKPAPPATTLPPMPAAGTECPEPPRVDCPTVPGDADGCPAVDSRGATKTAAPIYTGPVLANGTQYKVTVRGTYSAYVASQMAGLGGFVVCGTPEPAPLFASPGTTNGRVGVDPEFTFANPLPGKGCRAKTNAALPKHQTKVRFNTQGSTYTTPTADSVGPTPASDHAYAYTITGHGQALKIKIQDSNYLDNYGRLAIKVETA